MPSTLAAERAAVRARPCETGGMRFILWLRVLLSSTARKVRVDAARQRRARVESRSPLHISPSERDNWRREKSAPAPLRAHVRPFASSPLDGQRPSAPPPPAQPVSPP